MVSRVNNKIPWKKIMIPSGIIILIILIFAIGAISENKDSESKEIKNSATNEEAINLPEFIPSNLKENPGASWSTVVWWAKDFEYISTKMKLGYVQPEERGIVPDRWAKYGVEASEYEHRYLFNLSLSEKESDNFDDSTKENIFINLGSKEIGIFSIIFKSRNDIVNTCDNYPEICGNYTWAYQVENGNVFFYCPPDKEKFCRNLI